MRTITCVFTYQELHQLTPERCALVFSEQQLLQACGEVNRAVRDPESMPDIVIQRTKSGACKQGHAYTPENLIVIGGKERCRTCWNGYQVALAARRKAAKGAKETPV